MLMVNYPALKGGAYKDAIQARKTWVGHNSSWLRDTEVVKTHRRMLSQFAALQGRDHIVGRMAHAGER